MKFDISRVVELIAGDPQADRAVPPLDLPPV